MPECFISSKSMSLKGLCFRQVTGEFGRLLVFFLFFASLDQSQSQFILIRCERQDQSPLLSLSYHGMMKYEESDV